VFLTKGEQFIFKGKAELNNVTTLFRWRKLEDES